MPGILHQGILSLFCDDPWLGFDLLGIPRPVDGTPVDVRSEIDKSSQDGQSITQRYPDRTLVWRDPDDEQRGIVILVEAQGKIAREKRWRLPFYQAAAADEHELDAWMYVVSFSPAYSAAIQCWSEGLDVNSVKPMASIERARAWSTAAVLAGALHGHAGSIDAARMAIAACEGLPERVRRRYIATILAAARKPMREILKGEVKMEEYDDPLWDIEKTSGTYLYGLETGRAEGRAEGTSALIDMLLALLEIRGLRVDAASRARILACDSLEILRRWAQAAREVTDVRALFDWQPPNESATSP